METITVNGIEYIRADAAKPTDSSLKICVLDRGFVYIGHAAIEGDMLVISNARNVRIWGTTKGLGQLALEGPTTKTALDAVGTVRAPMRAVISMIDVRADKWTGI